MEELMFPLFTQGNHSDGLIIRETRQLESSKICDYNSSMCTYYRLVEKIAPHPPPSVARFLAPTSISLLSRNYYICCACCDHNVTVGIPP